MNLPDLNRLIIIQRNAPGVANSLGEKAESWSDFKTMHAERKDVSDSEKVAAGQVSGSLRSRFVIYSTSESRTIDTKDRLSHDNSIWQIHGVKQFNPGGFRQYLEITASSEID